MKLFKAIRANDARTIEDLVKEDRNLLTATGKHGQLPLIEAVEAGDASIVELLLSLSANVDATTKAVDGQTALLVAAWAGDDVILRALLAAGANLAARDAADRNLLHACAANHCPAILEFLLHPVSSNQSRLDADVCVRQQDKDGRTPIHTLCSEAPSVRPAAEMLQELLSAAPQAVRQTFSIRDAAGRTPMHCLVASSASESVVINLLETLAPEPGTLAITDDAGRTPIAEALCHGRLHLAKALAALNPAPLTQADNRGDTCLHHVVRLSAADCMNGVALLQRHGAADWAATNSAGDTAVEAADGAGNLQTVTAIGAPGPTRRAKVAPDPKPLKVAGDFSGRGTGQLPAQAPQAVQPQGPSLRSLAIVVGVFFAVVVPLLRRMLSDQGWI